MITLSILSVVARNDTLVVVLYESWDVIKVGSNTLLCEYVFFIMMGLLGVVLYCRPRMIMTEDVSAKSGS